MNVAMIRYILGCVLRIEGVLMLLIPCVTALLYGESEGFCFLVVALACMLVGQFASRKKPANSVIYLKEGCIATAGSWIMMSVAGCIPFMLTGEIPSFVDALFETVSGFTTTGASILTDVEALCRCSLLWRSFTHWVGGMGVLVFLLAIIPLNGGSHMNLMRAESPGPSVGKLVPKVRHTARILYLIYFVMTMLEILLLLAGGIPLFDAIATSFGTAGTGGFGIKNTSIAGYSAYVQWVTAIFMVLFGINFNAYYFFLYKQPKKALAMEEVRVYLIAILVAVGAITVDLLHMAMSVGDALRHAFFQVASVITTTGYATADFNLWSQSSKVILVCLMFLGACAGSTGGGMKVSRILIMVKTVVKELYSYIHPKSIRKVKLDGKPVEREVIRSVNVYFITFTILFILSVFLISLEGKDLVTTFTAVAATINNIGPGLEMVGPTGNYSAFTAFSKYVMIFDMLAGRLELFPMLILFHPTLWRELWEQNHPHRHRKNTRKTVLDGEEEFLL